MIERFAPAQVAAVFALAIVVGSVPALQPLLLGSLQAAGRLTPAELGYAGTLEGLGLLGGTMLATLLLPPRRLRPVAAASLLAAAAANLATVGGTATTILLARALSGLASGVILWLLVGMLTRAAAATRLFAIYVTSQATTAFLLSSLFALVMMPRVGAAGGYAALACADLLLLVPALLLIPRDYTPVVAGTMRLPTAPGAVGLVSIACYLAGVMALWVYLTPIALELGHAEAIVGRIVNASIALQIAGGLAATWLAARLPGARTTAACAALAALAVLALALVGTNLALLLVATCAFTFLWMFAPAFHLPMLIDLDPSRRTASFISVAQLGGVAVGPLAGSVAVGPGHYLGAAWASLILVSTSAILALVGSRGPAGA